VRSTSAREAVNEWTPSGPQIFKYLLTNGAQSTLDPRVGNAQSTQGKHHASSELSPNSPPADRAWRAFDWDGRVTLRSWYSERIPIQDHIKNTSRRRRGGAEWVPGGSNELLLWPLNCIKKTLRIRAEISNNCIGSYFSTLCFCYLAPLQWIGSLKLSIHDDTDTRKMSTLVSLVWHCKQLSTVSDTDTERHHLYICY
jgi:hypothetical protein